MSGFELVRRADEPPRATPALLGALCISGVALAATFAEGWGGEARSAALALFIVLGPSLTLFPILRFTRAPLVRLAYASLLGVCLQGLAVGAVAYADVWTPLDVAAGFAVACAVCAAGGLGLLAWKGRSAAATRPVVIPSSPAVRSVYEPPPTSRSAIGAVTSRGFGLRPRAAGSASFHAATGWWSRRWKILLLAVAVGALEVVILKSGWQTAGAVTVVVSIALLALHVIARSAGWVWSGRLLLFAVPVLLASGLALVERALSLL